MSGAELARIAWDLVAIVGAIAVVMVPLSIVAGRLIAQLEREARDVVERNEDAGWP